MIQITKYYLNIKLKNNTLKKIFHQIKNKYTQSIDFEYTVLNTFLNVESNKFYKNESNKK